MVKTLYLCKLDIHLALRGNLMININNKHMVKYNMTFIDLFAGLGGFHKALESLGCKCVFASELKSDLRDLYKINFPNTLIKGDITEINPNDVPAHDILCAGFPCQPFSQAGKRQGFKDEKKRGNLFDNICDILEVHKPRYVILENVSNLKGHDSGNTWKTILSKLEGLNYSVREAILSPHQFGIPQHRKRIYIVCQRKDFGNLDGFEFPQPLKKPKCDIKSIINENDVNITPLKSETYTQLEVWQEFLTNIVAHGDKLPGFPIWAMEFGATYDFKELAPAYQSLSNLRGKLGKLGERIDGNTVSECLFQLPIYAQTDKDEQFPIWKIRYIEQNRELYNRHKSWLDPWIEKVRNFENSHLKLEWNCGKKASPIIDDKIVQFRASGIRIKMPTFSPALNLVGTQTPIFPWITIPKSLQDEGYPSRGRYMTLREAASIQGMQELTFGNDQFKLTTSRCYEALGNAVNVSLVKNIAKKLFEYGK